MKSCKRVKNEELEKTKRLELKNLVRMIVKPKNWLID